MHRISLFLLDFQQVSLPESYFIYNAILGELESLEKSVFTLKMQLCGEKEDSLAWRHKMTWRIFRGWSGWMWGAFQGGGKMKW